MASGHARQSLYTEPLTHTSQLHRHGGSVSNGTNACQLTVRPSCSE